MQRVNYWEWLGLELKVRRRLVMVLLVILPFGVGLWTWFDPTVTGARHPALEEAEVQLFHIEEETDLDAARERTRRAVAILEEAFGEESRHLAKPLLAGGEVAWKRKDYEEARRHLERARRLGGCGPIADDGSHPPRDMARFREGELYDFQCVDAAGRLGEVLLELGEPSAALPYLKAWLDRHTRQARPLKWVATRAYTALARAQEEAGRPEAAARTRAAAERFAKER